MLDQLAAAGTLFLIFSGGELLLRTDFFELLEYARALRVRRQAQDQRAFSSRKRTRFAFAISACARCRSASTRTAPRSTTASPRCPARSIARSPRSGSSRRRPARADRQRADAAERRRLSRRAGAGGGAGRRVHARPDDHAEDGRRHVDAGPAHPDHASAAGLHRQVAGRRTADRAAAGEPSIRRRWTTRRAAPDIPPATSRRTATCIPACSFRCRAATCGASGSTTSGGIRHSSRRSARSASAICRPARCAAFSRTAPGAPGWPTWKATCGALVGGLRKVARVRSRPGESVKPTDPSRPTAHDHAAERGPEEGVREAGLPARARLRDDGARVRQGQHDDPGQCKTNRKNS